MKHLSLGISEEKTFDGSAMIRLFDSLTVDVVGRQLYPTAVSPTQMPCHVDLRLEMQMAMMGLWWWWYAGSCRSNNAHHFITHIPLPMEMGALPNVNLVHIIHRVLRNPLVRLSPSPFRPFTPICSSAVLPLNQPE